MKEPSPIWLYLGITGIIVSLVMFAVALLRW